MHAVQSYRAVDGLIMPCCPLCILAEHSAHCNMKACVHAETGMADDCALAGYYSRLLGILLSRSAEQILSYLKASCLPAVHCLLPRHTPSLSAVFGNNFMSFR